MRDFGELKKLSLPIMLHLKGKLEKDMVKRTTTKGEELICFSLMDSSKQSVRCVAHDITFAAELFTAGTEVAIFCATVREGIRHEAGHIWIYSTIHCLATASEHEYPTFEKAGQS